MRRVGIVKPYAIVDLNTKSPPTISAKKEISRKTSVTIFSKDCPIDSAPLSPPSYNKKNSISSIQSFPGYTSANCSSCPGSRSTTPSGKKGKIVPKRKAPPPPNNRPHKRTTRSNSVPPQFSTQERKASVKSARTTTMTVDLRVKDKTPPRKPPRTPSTFMTEVPPTCGDVDDEAVLYVLAQPNEYEPLRVPSATPPTGRAPSPGSGYRHPVLQQLQEKFDDTLGQIAQARLRELVNEDMWGLEWSDITVCTDESGTQQLYYHKHPIVLEVCCWEFCGWDFITITARLLCMLVCD